MDIDKISNEHNINNTLSRYNNRNLQNKVCIPCLEGSERRAKVLKRHIIKTYLKYNM